MVPKINITSVKLFATCTEQPCNCNGYISPNRSSEVGQIVPSSNIFPAPPDHRPISAQRSPILFVKHSTKIPNEPNLLPIKLRSAEITLVSN